MKQSYQNKHTDLMKKLTKQKLGLGDTRETNKCLVGLIGNKEQKYTNSNRSTGARVRRQQRLQSQENTLHSSME